MSSKCVKLVTLLICDDPLHVHTLGSFTRATYFCVLTKAESRAKILRQYNAFKHPVVSAASEILLPLIHCLMLLPLFVGFVSLVRLLFCSTYNCHGLVCSV